MEHRAPIDCTSKSGVRCDICFGPMPVLAETKTCELCFAPRPCLHDNPIADAARTIRTLHRENILLVDGGHIFTRDGVDVSGEIKALSAEQIVLCDEIIRKSPSLVFESDQNKISLQKVVSDIEEIKAARTTVQELPEIGNYGHET